MTSTKINKYLFKDDKHDYHKGAMLAINKLTNFLSNKKLEELKNKKLQINTKSFNEAQYLQSASELTICSYFSANFPNTFIYEDQINPPKDVDCSFESGGFKFNIEIKCADYTKSQNIDACPGIHLDSLGRYDDYYDLQKTLVHTFANKNLPVLSRKNMDNTLKDFLISAHNKFSQDTRKNHLNVLIVCCDTPEDIQKFHAYMFESQGLFTNHSFFDNQSYNLVDCVVLSNVYHRHHNYISKDKITNHWAWGDTFNLVFQNPYSCLTKIDAISVFINSIPNFSYDFFAYEGPEDSEGYIHRALKIPYLISILEDREGIVYFQTQ